MRYNTGVSTISNAQSNLMTVDPDKAAKVAAMLVNNYTSYVTPVREIIINGLEAVEDQEDGHVEVEFDSQLEDATTVFSNYDINGEGDYIINITDNGCGMSHDFAKNKFVHLTASSKDNSDDSIGGFGIGAKAVASISHHTVFRTVQDGIATVIVFGMSDKGATTSVSDPMEVDEPNGTKVSIHVDQDTFYSITSDIEDQFLDWIDPETPLTVSSSYGKDFQVGKKSQDVFHSYTHSNGVVVRMVKNHDKGMFRFKPADSMLRCVGMPYPTANSMKDPYEIGDSFTRALTRAIPGAQAKDNSFYLIIDVPPRDITIDSSRERVADTVHLRTVVNEAIDKAVEDYACSIAHSLKNSKDSQEFFDKIVQGFTCVELTSRRGALGNANSIVEDYTTYVEKNNDREGKGIFIINDEDDKCYKTGKLYEMSNDSIGSILDSWRAESISRVLENSNSIDDALGVDTHECSFVVVVDTKNNSSTAQINSGGLYDKILPDSFLNLFDNKEDIDLTMELVKWHLGIDAYTAPKSYHAIRKSIMARGRGKGKNGSHSKREIFSYIDDNENHKVVTAGDINDILSQWKNDNIATLVLLQDNNDNASIGYYQETLKNIDKVVRKVYGTDHKVVFVSAKRCDTVAKNVRILKDNADKVAMDINEDIFSGKDVTNSMSHITKDMSQGMGFLFFESSLDNFFGGEYSNSGIGYKWLDAEYGNSTIQDILVDYLNLDPEKYNKAKENIIETINVVSDEEPQSPDDTSADYYRAITGSAIVSVFHRFFYDRGNKDKTLNTVGKLFADGADYDEYTRRVQILFNIARYTCSNNVEYGGMSNKESAKFMGNIIATAQELADNPDSLATQMMADGWV